MTDRLTLLTQAHVCTVYRTEIKWTNCTLLELLKAKKMPSTINSFSGLKRTETKTSNKNRQDREPLLKVKYCQRAMSVQHFMNAGQLVQAVSCTQKTRDLGL